MPFLRRKGNVTWIGSKRTSRIKLLHGLNTSRAVSTSPVPHHNPRYRSHSDFHHHRWAV